MNIQQANFVKYLVENSHPLNSIAECFFNKFGSTKYCGGPSGYHKINGKKIFQFSSLEGNDIRTAAEIFFNKKFSK